MVGKLKQCTNQFVIYIKIDMSSTTSSHIAGKTLACHKASPLLDGCFTANELIDAYMKGQQSISQITPNLTTMYNLLKDTCSIIKDFYESNLKENGCFSIFMRMILDNVSIIAVIDENVFFDEKISRELYQSASNISRNNKQIAISFMPCREEKDINRAALLADNYFEIL